MIKALRVLFVLFLIVVFNNHFAFSATYTSATNGNWTTPATWGLTSGTPGDGDVVIIKNNVMLNSGSYTWWSSASRITIQQGGKLTVSGNLSLTGVGFKIILTKQGTFEVTGNLTMTNSPSITTNETAIGTPAPGAVLKTNGFLNLSDGAKVSLSTTATGTIGTSTSIVNLTLQSSGTTSVNNAGTLSVTGSVSNVNSLTNSGTMSVTGTYTNDASGGTTTNSGSMTVGTLVVYGTVGNSGTMTLTNFTAAGGTFTNTGIATVSALTKLTGGSLQLSPGASTSSRFTVKGIMDMSAWGNVTVGNGTPGSPAKYADLVVEGDVQDNAGHINVECNGRVAVFGDLNLNNWPNFTIKSCSPGVGGQVYVDGDGFGNSVTATQGHVTNQNASPYGLYVNGPTTGDVSPAASSIATMQSTNPSFYSWVASLPNSPLPVKLQYFKITALNEHGITLEWATSMEKDFSHFEVQRSGADLEFSTIAIVAGKGGLQVKTVYSTVDNQPVKGKNYYRLKAVDIDNSSEYFHVIVAEWSTAQGLSIYPNPAVNHSFTIDIGDEFDQPASLVVYETRGYVIYSAAVDVKTKVVELPANTTPGIYYVKVASTGKNKVVRLVVD